MPHARAKSITKPRGAGAHGAQRGRIMARPNWLGLPMKWLRIVAMGVCGSACSVAWCAPLPACSAPAFADESAALHEQRLRRDCGGDHSQWKVETPRTRPIDVGPSSLTAQFSSALTRTLDDWRNTLQLDWAGTHTETSGGLRTARATLAAASLWRWDEGAVHLKLGHEMAGLPSTRAAVASLWQPTRSVLVFAEWAGLQTRTDSGTQAHRLGARWWPVPGLMALDFAARQLPGHSAWVDQQLMLTFQLKP